MHLIKLKPQSSYISDLRSDTLWGLIIFSMSLIYEEQKLKSIIEGFRSGQPPFLISSAFPFVENSSEEIIYLFPKPKGKSYRPDDNQLSSVEKYKKFKKLKWLSMDNFEKYINNELDDVSFFPEYLQVSFSLDEDKKKPVKERKYKTTNDTGLIFDTINNEDYIKTSIDRLSGTTKVKDGKGQLHYSHEIYSKGGLFFLLDGNIDLVKPALNFLQHYGFGGDRSSGKGFFIVEVVDDFKLRLPDNTNKWMTLSLYSPDSEEISALQKSGKDNLFYELTYRSGRRNNVVFPDKQFEKNSIVCFTEGSVFPDIKRESYGLVKTSLETKDTIGHDILFNGFAFKIPMKLMEAENE